MKLNESLKDRLAIVLIILLLPILIPLLYLTPWIKKIWPLFKSLVFFVWWAIQGLSISAFGLMFLQSFLKEKDIELLGFTLMLFVSMGYAIIKLVRYIKFNKRWAIKKKELPLILLDKLRSGISLADLYSSTIYSDEFRNSYQYSYPHLVVEVLVDELSRLDGLKLDLNISEEWQNKPFDQEWYDKVSNELRKIGKINVKPLLAMIFCPPILSANGGQTIKLFPHPTKLNKRTAIPRHSEIKDILANKICKDLGVKPVK